MPSKRKLSTVDFATVEGTQLPKKPRINLTAPAPPEETSAGRVSQIKATELEQLKVELEETKRRLAQVKQESSHVQHSIECASCKDTIRNPYTLECGHSACYKCLRRWWVTPCETGELGDVSTDADSDEEQVIPTSVRTRSASRPPRKSSRLHFQSVIHNEKLCPECRKVLTTRPIPDRRLRDVVDAICPPLSVTELMERDRRWSRRQDVWRGIFPLHNGSSIWSTQPYILPPITQGRIQTPPSSLYRPLHPIHPLHSHHDSEVGQRRAERRSQPYNILERRRGQQYDPVREAQRNMEELRRHQRRSRALSPSSSPTASASLTPSVPLSRPPAAESASDPGPSLFVPADPSAAITDLRRLSETEIRSSQPRAHSSSPQTLRHSILLNSPSVTFPVSIPSISELLSLPLPSDVTLPPIAISNSSPAGIEVSEILQNDEVREYEDHEHDGDPPLSSLSGVGADLED